MWFLVVHPTIPLLLPMLTVWRLCIVGLHRCRPLDQVRLEATPHAVIALSSHSHLDDSRGCSFGHLQAAALWGSQAPDRQHHELLRLLQGVPGLSLSSGKAASPLTSRHDVQHMAVEQSRAPPVLAYAYASLIATLLLCGPQMDPVHADETSHVCEASGNPQSNVWLRV